MSLITAADARQLRSHFAEKLYTPVTIDYFTRRSVAPGSDACEACDDTEALLREVAALSDRIRLNVHELELEPGRAAELGVERVPALVLSGAARGRVRYLGIPAGYEFSSLVEDLIDVAAGTTDLATETKQALGTLHEDVHIQVFVTPTCPYCPAAARLAHKMAIESPRITADVVEASEFPDLVERYNVHGVPKTVVNERVEFVGAQPERRFLAHVLTAAA